MRKCFLFILIGTIKSKANP